jgi:hypothetical protein
MENERNIKQLIKTSNGITLIALVITIIVLLILAGVTIATLTGDNGILKQADKAKTETTMGEEKEAIGLAYNGAKTEKLGGAITAGDLNTQFTKNGIKATASGEGTIKVDFETGRSYTLDDHGKIEEWIDIAKYVKVGDFVDYNPTITTKDGTTSVETSKLSYSSPIGTATEHGNGNSVQNFTATEKTRWRVLSIENGVVELISENVIKSDTNANFILEGARGYLYAERELNEVCKIFGYGYGADTTKGGSYTTGGPKDTLITGKVGETGARSITIEDINKKAGITEADYTTLDSSYGSITNPTSNVYYPTVNGDSTTGKSTSARVKKLKYTFYIYDKSKIENTDIQNMLFNGNYWLASRCIVTSYNQAYFDVRSVDGDDTDAYYLCYGYSSNFNEIARSSCAVRPVVTLKSDIIDVSTNYSTEGKWKLK